MNWFVENKEWFAGVIGTVVAFFGGKKLRERELKEKDVSIESNQTIILSENLKLYQTMLDDIDNRYDKNLKKTEEAYLKEIETIHKKHAEEILRISNKYKEEIDNLRQVIDKLKKKYESS